MRPLASVLALAAQAALLVGCDGGRSIAPAGDLHLAAASSALAAPSGTTPEAFGLRMHVRWIDNSGTETAFEIHRSTTGESGPFTLLATAGTNATSHDDAGLGDGRQYCYRVRAARSSGNTTRYSAFSNTACAWTQPLAPSNVTAVVVSETQIDVGWQDNSSTETSFRIERAWDRTAPFYPLATTEPGVTTYADRSVQAGVEFCYRVQAVVTFGDGYYVPSTWSDVACARIPVPSVPPPAAYVVSAFPPNSSEILVMVRWTDTTPAPAFRMYASYDRGTTWQSIVLPTHVYPTFSDYPVATEATVCYRVVAYTEAGDAPPSNAACATPPAAPTNLATRAVDAETLELTWTDASAVEDGYEVWLGVHTYSCCTSGSACDAGGYEYIELVATLPPNSTARHVAVYPDSCGSSAYYFVTAAKDGGRSDESVSVSASVP